MSTISAGPTTTSAAEAADALRTTLRLNATTSLLGGLAAIAAAGPIDRLLGTGEPGWVRVTGVGLLLFAGGVATSGATVDRMAGRTPLISAADATWVAASAGTIAAGWYSARGTAIVAAVAVGVAAFCARQLALVRRLA